ncbi:MAG: translesion DNA synthesis-associated protein ImuA [Rhodoferax sp.]|nr:translesion DNA synthesis-associated protein ImuA [Rhodoferax sp.]
MVSRPLPVSFAHLGDAVWRADELACAAGATVATGHPALDAQLPGGGWPVGAISEILQGHSGQGEWRLLLPALTRAVHAAPGPVVLVGAPHVPFGPGLWAQGFEARRLLWVTESAPAARLWAAEQALRCAEVVAVLAWLPQVRAEQLRRLQMAAQEHSKLLFVLRPAQAQSESSPAVLRLLASTSPGSDALLLHILKRRGPPLDQPLTLLARPARLAALLASHARQADDEAQGVGARRVPALCFFPGSGDALDRTAAAA